MLRYKKVTALIPANNKNAFTPNEFTLNVVEDLYYTPILTDRTFMHASQVCINFSYWLMVVEKPGDNLDVCAVLCFVMLGCHTIHNMLVYYTSIINSPH